MCGSGICWDLTCPGFISMYCLPARCLDAAWNTAYNYRIIGTGFAFVCLFSRVQNMHCAKRLFDALAAVGWRHNGAGGGVRGDAALRQIRAY